MVIAAERQPLERLTALHDLHRKEANCQLIRDSFWARGLLDAYAITVNDRVAGYGAVANHYDEGAVLEFFTFGEFRRHASSMFQALLSASAATHISAQTNMPLLGMMLYEFGTDIAPQKVLFEDAWTSDLPAPPGAIFRRRRREDELPVFPHHHEPEGDWLIECEREVVATGGFLTHYNPPYADLFMEVSESRRSRGIGAYLIQELKRVCYESGKQPAARCDTTNIASRRTLEKAGLLACGYAVMARVK